VEVIQQARKPELYRLIFGLGIRHVGEKASKTLAREFGSMKKLMSASQDDLESIHEIGPEMAKSLVEYFADKEHLGELRELLDLVTPVVPGRLKVKAGFSGKTFVLTGTLPTLSRSDASRLIEDAGGRVSSSVSKKTDYLVAGEAAGSKLKKAEDCGVEIIDEEKLKQLLSDR